MKPVKVLKSTEDLARIKSLLNIYPLTEWEGDIDTFIKFGYNTVSSGAKETYHLLKGIAMASYNQDKSKGYKCQVSYDFLAVALNTVQHTQIRRIKELINAALIQKTKQQVNSNIYTVVVRPCPDSTFETTLRRLILRRDCMAVLRKVDYDSSLDNLPEEHLRLSKLFKSPFCKPYILTKLPNFQPVNIT